MNAIKKRIVNFSTCSLAQNNTVLKNDSEIHPLDAEFVDDYEEEFVDYPLPEEEPKKCPHYQPRNYTAPYTASQRAFENTNNYFRGANRVSTGISRAFSFRGLLVSYVMIALLLFAREQYPSIADQLSPIYVLLDTVILPMYNWATDVVNAVITRLIEDVPVISKFIETLANVPEAIMNLK